MSHSHEDIFENRKQFQLERAILFTDAVFAIAITLLVIEIKAPHLEETDTNKKVIMKLLEMFPLFLGYFISFMIIGSFWLTHHRLFFFVTDYDRSLLWRNIFLLFFIALIPFSTAFYCENFGSNIAFMIYSANNFAIGMMIYRLWAYLSKHHERLTHSFSDPKFRRYCKTRSLVIALIFLSGVLLSFINSAIVFWFTRYFLFVMIFPAIVIVNRVFKMKM